MATTAKDHLTDSACAQEFTKDALIRQKNEYKRRKADLEERVAELENRSKFHDDHLRIIDLWFSQVGINWAKSTLDFADNSVARR